MASCKQMLSLGNFPSGHRSLLMLSSDQLDLPHTTHAGAGDRRIAARQVVERVERKTSSVW